MDEPSFFISETGERMTTRQYLDQTLPVVPLSDEALAQDKIHAQAWLEENRYQRNPDPREALYRRILRLHATIAALRGERSNREPDER